MASALGGNCELHGIDFILGAPARHSHSRSPLILSTCSPGPAAVVALIRGCVVASISTDHRLVRWFKALPSGRFGSCILSTGWQHLVGLQIIAATTGPGKQFRSPHRSLISLRRPGDACRPRRSSVPRANLFVGVQSKPHPVYRQLHDFEFNTSNHDRQRRAGSAHIFAMP